MQKLNSIKDDLKSTIEIANQITAQLLIIYSFPEKTLKQETLKKIESFSKELNKYYSSQCDSLKEKALAGDLEVLANVFPLLKGYLKKDFYESLSSPLQTKLIPIYDYLNENSTDYKHFISKITREKQYPITKKVTETFFGEVNAQFYAHAKISLLFMLYTQNHIALFETLLRHGACANEWGIKPSQEAHLEYSLFRSIAGQDNDPDTYVYPYLKILLAYQADSNEVYTKEFSRERNASKIRASKKTFKEKIRYKEGRIFSSKIYCTPSVNSLGSRAGLQGLQLVLNHTSIENLAFCLGEYFCVPELISAPILKSSYGLHFYNNTGLNIEHKTDSMPIFIAYNFYSSAPLEGQQCRVTSTEIYKKIKFLQSQLAQKIILLDEMEFSKAYEKLLDFAISILVMPDREKTGFLSYFALLGCEFLLMTRCLHLHNTIGKQVEYLKSYNINSLYNQFFDCFKMIGQPTRIPVYQKSLKVMYTNNIIHELKEVQVRSLASSERNMGLLEESGSDSDSEFENLEEVDTVTPICQAARDGQLEKLQQLLNEFPQNIDKAAPGTGGWTALHFACAKNQTECAKALILSGANLLAQNDKKQPPKASAELKALHFIIMTSKVCKK